MTMVGQLQWLITLGRFDIMPAVAALGSFRAMPKKGHLERAKRLYGFMAKYKDAAITNRVDIPDFSQFDTEHHPDWAHSIYGPDHEQYPHNMPEPLGKLVRITEFVDTNLYFDLVTGRACTGILIFLNQPPVDWYCKKQSTVATATYGSEFVAAKTGAEKAYDLRYECRMLGIPLEYQTYMFGDNASVVMQGTIPHSKLTKRHHALSYHYVREAVTTGMLKFFHLPGVQNPADVLTKFLGYQQWWPLLNPILYWRGDTADIQQKGSETSTQS